MLPNRFTLARKTEEKLKREKQQTGIPPNILARELFFLSVESGKVFQSPVSIEQGNMTLDKNTWLGETQEATVSILNNLYNGRTAAELAIFWSMHVAHGVDLKFLK